MLFPFLILTFFKKKKKKKKELARLKTQKGGLGKSYRKTKQKKGRLKT